MLSIWRTLQHSWHTVPFTTLLKKTWKAWSVFEIYGGRALVSVALCAVCGKVHLFTHTSLHGVLLSSELIEERFMTDNTNRSTTCLPTILYHLTAVLAYAVALLSFLCWLFRLQSTPGNGSLSRKSFLLILHKQLPPEAYNFHWAPLRNPFLRAYLIRRDTISNARLSTAFALMPHKCALICM